jgi:hypothetical protein
MMGGFWPVTIVLLCRFMTEEALKVVRKRGEAHEWARASGSLHLFGEVVQVCRRAGVQALNFFSPFCAARHAAVCTILLL